MNDEMTERARAYYKRKKASSKIEKERGAGKRRGKEFPNNNSVFTNDL